MRYSLLTPLTLLTAAVAQEHFTAPSAASASSSARGSGTPDSYSNEYEVIQFENVGYSGSYYLVDSISNVDSEDDCTCSLSTSKTKFKGKLAPLDEELSVHFRGPLSLKKFGFYTSEDFYVVGGASTNNWTRVAHYDSSAQSTTNVTFMNLKGAKSPCLGNALSYAASDGKSKSDDSEVLDKDVVFTSDEEFSVYSSVQCGDSGTKGDCGVYRDGIPAYHGFYGGTKMFLFEFTMPDESSKISNSSLSSPNMPAIWLLNSHIARTSQYPTNSNCSCWTSGCGEFDIFEVMNTTDQNRMYSTIHDYQGISDIGTGIQAQAYLARDTQSTMMGGVVFDSNGTATVFMSNDTSFDSIIAASDLYSWIDNSTSSMATDTLKSVSGSWLSTPSMQFAAFLSVFTTLFMFYM